MRLEMINIKEINPPPPQPKRPKTRQNTTGLRVIYKILKNSTDGKYFGYPG
jgi:hypothetical protein